MSRPPRRSNRARQRRPSPAPAARKKPDRMRVDELLVQRGCAPDLGAAQALILAGRVHGDGKRYTQAGRADRPRR